MRESITVALLAISNLGTAVAAQVAQVTEFSWIKFLEPYLHFLIGIGQVAVAIVTVVYIWKKIKNFPSKGNKNVLLQ
jgi:hypothetical protein